jgi:hypothetical protein
MPASPANNDVPEEQKLQQYLREYSLKIVQSIKIKIRLYSKHHR